MRFTASRAQLLSGVMLLGAPFGENMPWCLKLVFYLVMWVMLLCDSKVDK